AKGNRPRPDTDKFAVNLNVYLRLSSKGEARILKRLDPSLEGADDIKKGAAISLKRQGHIKKRAEIIKESAHLCLSGGGHIEGMGGQWFEKCACFIVRRRPKKEGRGGWVERSSP